MAQEQRIARRREFSCRAKVLVSDGHSVSAVARDVASGGIALLIPEPLELGQSCVVAFALPCAGGPRPVSARATVRHIAKANDDGYSAGLRFVEIDSFSAWVIGKFVVEPGPGLAVGGDRPIAN